MRSALATPKTRYRSVKYKLNRQNTTSFDCIEGQKIAIHKPSQRRVSESKNIKKMNFTADINRSNSQLKNIENEEDFSEKKFMKSTYMNSFHEILSIQKSKRQNQKKNQTSKNFSSKRDSRVCLPVLNEGDSFFTVLDNIHLPIIYIQEQITKAEGKLKEEEVNIAKIRANLKEIDKKLTKSIEETEKIGLKGFQKLKAMLKSNKVYQQEIRLKLKSSFETSRAYLPQFYKKFESSKQDVQELQTVIFANTPFELKQKEEFEIISSHYF